MTATSTSAVEFTRDPAPLAEATRRDRVVVAGAEWDDRSILALRGRIEITVLAAGSRSVFTATVSPAFVGGSSLVVRTGADRAEHTFAYDSSCAAGGLAPDLRDALADPATRVGIEFRPVTSGFPPPGLLHLVGLPIGNPGDLTPRARRVLEGVDLVLAEDTRRFRSLARDLGLNVGEVTSHHLGNEAERTAPMVALLAAGGRLALVTDAGTPLISDPGFDLVRSCRREGIGVRPVPGASAPVAALVASGIPAHGFTFLGFLPRRSSARREVLGGSAGLPGSVVFFEAPHRLLAALDDLAAVLPGREVFVACEMTKMYEQFFSGRTDAGAGLLGGESPRGEYTVVVGPAPPRRAAPGIDPAALRLAAELRAHVGTRDLATALASATGVSRRAAYDAVLGMPTTDTG